MVSTRMVEHVGRVLAGRYRLVAPLGVGAAGRVFLADDARLRRRVAVKLLHEALAADEAFLRRFRAEATAAASLNHPHIVSVYDWGEDGEPFLVLEYLGGGNLRTMLDGDRPLPPSQSLKVGLEAARGLDHAHRRGIVHRDVKPANLLFDGEGHLRIADFGVARALAEAAWTEPEGVLVGSARYASPEQARGETLDGRSDVYSLALVLVESVSGQVPFAADTTVATLMARAEAPIPVPEEAGLLGDVLAAAGHPDPAERPSAAEFGQALFDLAPRLPSPRPLPLAAEPAATVADAGPVTSDPTNHGADTAASATVVTSAVGDDGPPLEPRRKRRKWPWFLLLLLVLAGTAAAAAALLGSQVPEYEVPDVLGADEASAIEELRGGPGEWEVTVEREFRDRTLAGTVVGLDPPPGSMLKEGGTLTLTVSQGPPPVALPALEGVEQGEAAAALEQEGFVLGEIIPAHHEDIAPGSVITWFVEDLERPTEAPKGSTVKLAVSVGPAPRTVPDLAGLTVDEATAKITEAGLQVGDTTEEFSSDVPKGSVISSSPAAGQELERGAKVNLVVSKGKDLVKIPDVEGKRLDQAKKALEDAGLDVKRILGDPDNRVLSTDPPAGESVERGTDVVIYMRGFSDD